MYQVTAPDIQKALSKTLSKRSFMPKVTSSMITVDTDQPGQFYKFSARLSANFTVLPTPDQVVKTYNDTGKKGQGAKWLLLGAVQVPGEQLRVTVRIVRTETSEVVRASKGDGDTSYEGLCDAFQAACAELQLATPPAN